MKKLILLTFLFVTSTVYGAAADMMVTVAGAGDNSGSSWANAMALADFITDINGSAEAGDRYFLLEGTYTLPAATPIAATGQDGTAAAPIWLIGVKTGTTNEPPVAADWAYTTARPEINGSTNDQEEIDFGDYYITYNINFVTDNSNGGTAYGANGRAWNCRFEDDSGSSSGFEATSGSWCDWIQCEFTTGGGNPTGAAPSLAATFINCNFDTCGTGLVVSNTSYVIYNCVFDTCGTGINMATVQNGTVLNNVFYNCTTGITASASYGWIFANNVFDECTDDATWTTATPINYWDYNHWEEAGPGNITKGPNALTGDPGLNNPAAEDFSLANSSSGPTDTALKFNTNVGVTGTYKYNMGVDQDDNAAGGGGTTPYVRGKNGGKQ